VAEASSGPPAIKKDSKYFGRQKLLKILLLRPKTAQRLRAAGAFEARY